MFRSAWSKLNTKVQKQRNYEAVFATHRLLKPNLRNALHELFHFLRIVVACSEQRSPDILQRNLSYQGPSLWSREPAYRNSPPQHHRNEANNAQQQTKPQQASNSESWLQDWCLEVIEERSLQILQRALYFKTELQGLKYTRELRGHSDSAPLKP